MVKGFAGRPPIWFWIAALLLLSWEAIGCYFCFQQFRLGADTMPSATNYDRALYASLPAWYNWTYALAVGTGALGGLALFMRKATAKPLYIVSLIALLVQFGYLFAATDIIVTKGLWTIYFPAFIAAAGGFAIWLTDKAVKRRWIS